MQLAKTNFDFVTTAIFSALETQNAEQQKQPLDRNPSFFGGFLDFSFGREVTVRKMFMSKYNKKSELSRYLLTMI